MSPTLTASEKGIFVCLKVSDCKYSTSCANKLPHKKIVRNIDLINIVSSYLMVAIHLSSMAMGVGNDVISTVVRHG